MAISLPYPGVMYEPQQQQQQTPACITSRVQVVDSCTHLTETNHLHKGNICGSIVRRLYDEASGLYIWISMHYGTCLLVIFIGTNNVGLRTLHLGHGNHAMQVLTVVYPCVCADPLDQ
jgi:hypothetical protein